MEGSYRILFSVFVLFLISGCSSPESFESQWNDDPDRYWVGAEYWANRLQDWQINQGRLECLEGRREKPMRTVHLLTHSLSARPDEFEMTVETGLLSDKVSLTERTWSGFLVGAGGGTLDYRAAALVHHAGGSHYPARPAAGGSAAGYLLRPAQVAAA